MLARPAALSVRFPAMLVAVLAVLSLDPLGLPGFFFPGATAALFASRSRALVRRAISASIEAIRAVVSMSGSVYVAPAAVSRYNREAAQLRHGLGPS